MKFLFGFVTCCASCSSETRRMAEETNLLVIQEPRRRIARKQGRVRGRGREWRPSLTSISEDVLSAEKINNVERQAPGWRRRLERKVATLSQSDRSRSLDHEDYRRGPASALMPTFSPTPFMF